MAIDREKAETAYEAVGLIQKAKNEKRNKVLFVLMLIVGIIVLIAGAVWLFDEFEIDNPSTGGWIGSIVVVVVGLVLIIGGSLIQGLGKKHREKVDSKELGEKLYRKIEEDAETEYKRIFAKKSLNKIKPSWLDDNFTNIGKVVVLSQHAEKIRVNQYDMNNFCFSFAVLFDNGASALTIILDNKDGNSGYFAYLHLLYQNLHGTSIHNTGF